MYKICKTQESIKRQHSFEISLLNLMKTTSYKSISITDLCKEVGISRKNFYRYFTNKDDVLLALIDHTIQEYPKYIFPFPKTKEDIFTEMEQYLSFWKSHRLLLDALFKNRLGSILVERVIRHAWRFDKSLLNTSSSLQEPNNVSFVISGIITLVFLWHNKNYEPSESQLATTICKLLSEPIFPIEDTR